MLHIKTINELFGFGKKPDDDIVKDILNKVDGSIEFEFTSDNEILKNTEKIEFILNEFNIQILCNSEMDSRFNYDYEYEISLDDTILNVSKNLMEKLHKKCKKLYNNKIQSEKNNEGDYTKNDYRITNKLKK